VHANKCDVCGVLYEQYGTRESRGNCNSILLANTDAEGKYWLNGRVDLCPSCQKQLYALLRIELVKPESERKP